MLGLSPKIATAKCRQVQDYLCDLGVLGEKNAPQGAVFRVKTLSECDFMDAH